MRHICPHPIRDPCRRRHDGGLSLAGKNFAIDPQPSRRRFLQGGAAAVAGLTIGFHWNAGVLNSPCRRLCRRQWSGSQRFRADRPDNTVTVIVKHLEMGQGSYTGLATIVAEELDADWAQIRVEGAPADAKLYNNLNSGRSQGTGGSSAIANSYDQLRKAGATARAMLVDAAAKEWGVDRAAITVEKGVVKHAESGEATFGELAGKAAGLPVPTDVPLKDPSRFTLIGSFVPRVDAESKTNGTAQFTLDVKLPGMLTAVVARPPVFGATPQVGRLRPRPRPFPAWSRSSRYLPAWQSSRKTSGRRRKGGTR